MLGLVDVLQPALAEVVASYAVGEGRPDERRRRRRQQHLATVAGGADPGRSTTSIPTYPSSPVTGSPVCRLMRIRSSTASGQA